MLIGHSAQLSFLRRSFESGNLAHAYLFVGPEGVGKKKMASELANWCLGRIASVGFPVKPGMTTGSVGRIEEGGLVDDLSHDWQIKFVERVYDEKTGKLRKDISIKQIHEVRESLNHHSLVSSYKIVIIDSAEQMSISAANALLKTLEEPSPKTLIVLLTTDEKALPDTIVSRCQVVRFYQVPTKKIYNALLANGANRDMALEIARLAFGSPGRALDLLADSEKLKFFQNERVRFWQLLSDGLAERLACLANLFGSKDDHIEARDKLIEILKIWQTLWRDILYSRQGAGELVANIAKEDEIKKQAKRYSGTQIAEMIKKIEDSIALLRQNVNPKLIIENLILSFY
ncbi:MAG TPA: hypothetical protein DEB73_00335 [Candidatus Magasanikbacteria bacterium]|uniref:DNA polymerase III subunit delta' n=2 Tax=Candidatus Magasanikiibacteriota TaxID=1752731 RepID=A0A0G0WL77_9BACT|nr:MAG: polymerase III, delta prime subunit protein [Candidatus Magasanikbacteria bacterium GW2011_GWC2_41_17]KKS13569.1 MAG: polymerase III, delta prime subunit protein [Candidatus Magasanikbacteria bacterium GW2011_GWA2_41_55]HBV57716.1 hypothetical protein [Candidatus Magasanikbacteria bacterium]HBX16213.1 hypothetical protein [Candidatus Magasanikbacteria bacterium]